MRPALYTLLAAIGIMCALPADRAEALEVFGNPGLGNSGPNISTLNLAGTYGPSVAQGFRTGNTVYNLSAVQMAVNFQSTTPTNFSLGLYSSIDQSGIQVPGSLIGSFNVTSPSPAYSANSDVLYTFTYAGTSGTEVLATQTNYWVVAANSTTTSFNWVYSTGSVAPSEQNSSGYSPISTGSTVGKTRSAPTVWALAPTQAGVSFRVIVVPEPSTYALGIVGTLVMGTVARRKSRKPAKA